MKPLLSIQHNKVHYKNYLLLLVVCLLAWWPLTFGIFSVKNDAVHYFLPYRFNISEAIRNGEMPFWSPYIYLGNPVYGDMQSGAWNPVVWIFSLFGRYDMTLFHAEHLLYLFLGGVGMYKLTLQLIRHPQTALLIGASYMLSGFMLGGQLINWLAAAAFFPFAVHYYLKCLRSPGLADGMKTGIAMYLLLTAGYPSFFIITCYIMAILLAITVVQKLRDKEKPEVSWTRFTINQLLIVVVFAGLAMPAIISYIDLLPYYSRGGGTSYKDTLSNSFEWQHLVTLFFPTALKGSDIVSSTDITCRNVYTGLLPLVLLAVFPPKLNRRNILLMLLGLFALFFSLGDATPVRKLCYQLVPLMDTFRHPSQARLFFVFAMLLLAAPGLRSLLEKEKPLTRITAAGWIALVITAIITTIALFSSTMIQRVGSFRFSALTGSIKSLLESITLADTILIGGIVQLAFLVAFLFWLKKQPHNKKAFSFLWIANLFIMAQFALPVSFVSKTSPAAINRLIHASPKGFPTAGLSLPLDSNSKDAFDHYDEIAMTFFYNKKVGISRVAYSPSFLAEQDDFLNSELLYNYVASKPVAYLADSVLQYGDSLLLGSGGCSYATTDLPIVIADSCANGNDVVIKKLCSNRFEMEATTVSTCMLVLTQSYHHYWKAIEDGKNQPIYKVNRGFMGIVVPAGTHKVVFQYAPVNTINTLWLMGATILLMLIAAAVSLFRQQRSAA